MSNQAPSSGDSIDPGMPDIVKRRGISPVWLLPLVALSAAGWLLYKSVVEKGPVVDIEFATAQGIVEGKTKVIYRGLELAIVSQITLHKDLQGVTVTVDFQPGSENVLKKDTLFWLVKPRVTLSGVSGLDTLMTGHYIGILPGVSEDPYQEKFVALQDPPPRSHPNAGLHFKLITNTLGSIGEGSQIYYRQVPVGEVVGHQFSEDDKSVVIDAYVFNKYTHLVKKNTRFWNISGLKVKAGLSGIEIKTESVVSMLAGGIAFQTPATKNPPDNSVSGSVYKLYDDFDSAELGIPAILLFKDGFGIDDGRTKVVVDGLTVGIVKSTRFAEKFGGVAVKVMFDPSAEGFLREDTQFWLVKPSFSLAGLSDLNAMLSGNYIAARPGSGKPANNFIALESPPANVPNLSGLRLRLKADELGSLGPGAPVTYKQIPVGEVQGYELTDDKQQVLIEILIRKKYETLVNASSRFWNASGIEISGGGWAAFR